MHAGRMRRVPAEPLPKLTHRDGGSALEKLEDLLAIPASADDDVAGEHDGFERDIQPLGQSEGKGGERGAVRAASDECGTDCRGLDVAGLFDRREIAWPEQRVDDAARPELGRRDIDRALRRLAGQDVAGQTRGRKPRVTDERCVDAEKRVEQVLPRGRSRRCGERKSKAAQRHEQDPNELPRASSFGRKIHANEW